MTEKIETPEEYLQRKSYPVNDYQPKKIDIEDALEAVAMTRRLARRYAGEVPSDDGTAEQKLTCRSIRKKQIAEAEERGYKKHEKEMIEKAKPWLECLTSDMVNEDSKNLNDAFERGRQDGFEEGCKKKTIFLEKNIENGLLIPIAEHKTEIEKAREEGRQEERNNKKDLALNLMIGKELVELMLIEDQDQRKAQKRYKELEKTIEARVRLEERANTAKEIFEKIKKEMVCKGCNKVGIEPDEHYRKINAINCCPESNYRLNEINLNRIIIRFLKPTDKEAKP